MNTIEVKDMDYEYDDYDLNDEVVNIITRYFSKGNHVTQHKITLGYFDIN